ncbi:chorismate mutase [Seiridium cupressi]
MDTAIDLSDPTKALDLANIRDTLIRLEDTIIFHLIERVHFPYNKTIYTPGAIEGIPDANLSFMEWYLQEQEKLQARIRRFQSPDEYPFFPETKDVKPVLQAVEYPQILHKNNVNVNAKIKDYYVEKFLPKVCRDFGREDRGESKENYGSSATCDIQCLQAISRRIHFGKFVAESKFRSERDHFTKLIQAKDGDAIGDAITKPEVERQVLRRLALKAKTYGKDPASDDKESRIDVDKVVEMYEQFVIPITKEVEVDYLLTRLED